MILVVDIGNSRVKVAVFEAGHLKKVLPYSHAEFPTEFPKWVEKENLTERIQYIGCASVGNKEMLKTVARVASDIPDTGWLSIDHQSPLPVGNAYASPKTLGMDRICACVGARQRKPKGPLLVIDAGTAITYDFLDAQNRYQGGGIAPGLRLRFKALNTFTASLPLVEKEGDCPLIGYSTETSIRSGVVNGMLAEVDGIIQRYKKDQKEDFEVFLTGGDAVFLGNRLKNINFVDANLLLYGIHAVITYNISNA